jgi:hypothetical protein
MIPENCTIKTAGTGFKCPACGKQVKPGDNYLDQDGVKTCLCAMPVRKLIPLSRIQKLESLVRYLEIQNLRMKLDLEVLSSFPDGAAAKKILNKYIRRRKIREEQALGIKN